MNAQFPLGAGVVGLSSMRITGTSPPAGPLAGALADGSMIRMKTVVPNIIRTDEFTPCGEPI